MKIKKYVAPSMPEAMKQIRSELGADAVILNSKIVQTGGFLGFFKKKNIEVIAAVDNVPKPEPRVKEKSAADSYNRMNRASEPVRRTTPGMSANKGNVSAKTSEEILSELQELKALLENLSPAKKETIKYPKMVEKINDLLIRQEIDDGIREEIVQALLIQWYRQGASASFDQVLLWCRDMLTKRIAGYSYGGLSFTKKYVNVIGPTGVGKTTTLAKIAADCTLKYEKKVAFITTDTFRIAAVEQLKTYAKILSIPLEVCYDLNDFRQACLTFKDFDLILIDTAGRNYRNAYYIKELKNIIDFQNEMETYLVLSLTAKQKDMEEVFRQFEDIPIRQFIFTKMDETANIGSMYNMIDKYKKGAAYITNGQNVPDDIISASAEGITKLILGVE